ncbi:MAG: hypothetical protein WC882_00410 [Candidatus Gracilibacteria bacterium]
MKIHVDKIGSVAKNARLPREVEISKTLRPEQGAILVVKVLENKKIYNRLELTSGKMSVLRKDDVVVVALGNRRALKGFVGEVPKTLKAGDVIHILNIGGVAGLCTDASEKEVGKPLKVRVLGQVLGPNSSPLTLKTHRLFEPHSRLESRVPLIVVSGTCMNTGKTSVACEIIRYASAKKWKVFSAKLAGVAAIKDLELMKKNGAKQTVSFVDAGYASTVRGNGTVAAIAKGAIDYLSQGKPDVIVIEFGDGIFGEYGVQTVLKDPEIQSQIGAHIGCANDPAGALKLVEICQELGAPLNVISGPVTDNSVGVNFLHQHLKIPACNALTHGKNLFEHVLMFF